MPKSYWRASLSTTSIFNIIVRKFLKFRISVIEGKSASFRAIFIIHLAVLLVSCAYLCFQSTYRSIPILTLYPVLHICWTFSFVPIFFHVVRLSLLIGLWLKLPLKPQNFQVHHNERYRISICFCFVWHFFKKSKRRE